MAESNCTMTQSPNRLIIQDYNISQVLDRSRTLPESVIWDRVVFYLSWAYYPGLGPRATPSHIESVCLPCLGKYFLLTCFEHQSKFFCIPPAPKDYPEKLTKTSTQTVFRNVVVFNQKSSNKQMWDKYKSFSNAFRLRKLCYLLDSYVVLNLHFIFRIILNLNQFLSDWMTAKTIFHTNSQIM